MTMSLAIAGIAVGTQAASTTITTNTKVTTTIVYWPSSVPHLPLLGQMNMTIMAKVHEAGSISNSSQAWKCTPCTWCNHWFDAKLVRAASRCADICYHQQIKSTNVSISSTVLTSILLNSSILDQVTGFINVYQATYGELILFHRSVCTVLRYQKRVTQQSSVHNILWLHMLHDTDKRSGQTV